MLIRVCVLAAEFMLPTFQDLPFKTGFSCLMAGCSADSAGGWTESGEESGRLDPAYYID